MSHTHAIARQRRLALRALWAAAALLGALLLGAAALPPVLSQAAPRAQAAPIYLARAEGTLTRASAAYLRRALREAEAAGAAALVIELRSGAGVLRELRPLASDIAAATLPVIVFVAPSGTRSGAPGAFLLSAAHLSALAPDTSFGSPAPLAAADSALSASAIAIVRDSVADELREWNRAHGRSVAWAEQAAQSGAVLTNAQAAALDPPAVDLVAADLDQLLLLADGRRVALAGNQEATLALAGRTPTLVEPTAAERLWQLLSEPIAVFTLIVLGALAIFLELAAPGTTVFVGIGVLLLLAGGVGALSLPLQGWAVALVLLALLLAGLELVVASHGGLMVAGLALLAIGGLNLVDQQQAPGVGVPAWAVVVVTVAMGGVALLGLALALRVRGRPASTGSEALVGRLAEVRSALAPQGMVFVEGALWQAVCEEGRAEAGEWVRVVAVHRLRLIVRPVDAPAPGEAS